MLTEIVQPQPRNDPGNKTDLSALAEHLSEIADALRKTTGNPTAEKRLATPESSGPDRGREFNTSNVVAAHSDTQGRANTPTIHSDLKMRRLQFAARAREAYAIRRRRTVIFDNSELFGEPAWDILLDLYIAHAENKQVSVSSACIGSAAPPTTGLRWLGVLSEQGLILREHDPVDQRRVLVRLAEKGLTAMDDYFSSISPKA